MTLYASWHHSDAHDPAAFGLPVAPLRNGVKGNWAASRERLLAAPAGCCLNIEPGKELGSVSTSRFLIADLARQHADEHDGVRPSVYGVSQTDYWPGGTSPRSSGYPVNDERRRALALGPVVNRVEADAYMRWALTEIDTAAEADAVFKLYYRGLQVHRERCRAFWRDEDGRPLQIRWWISNRNLQTEVLPPWWIKGTAEIMADFRALGDEVCLFQGWVGEAAVAWTDNDAAFVAAFKRATGV